MRLFVALDIEDGIRRRLSESISRWRAAAAAARWQSPESLHVTLKFIGEFPDARIPELARALAQVRAQSFPVTIQGCGFFPTAKAPRVLWAGVEGAAALSSLAHAADQATAAVGIESESRAYSPHLTLARAGAKPEAAKALKQLAAQLEKEPTPVFGTMAAQEFFLYRSELGRGGSRYTKLERFPLG